jgi:hypothetical protein
MGIVEHFPGVKSAGMWGYTLSPLSAELRKKWTYNFTPVYDHVHQEFAFIFTPKHTSNPKSTCGFHIQDVFKKEGTFAIKTLLLILQHCKHCPLQRSPLYWRYTVPNVSSIFGLLPGTHFLWWRAVLLSHFPESPRWFLKRRPFKVVLSLGNRKKSAGAKSGE